MKKLTRLIALTLVCALLLGLGMVSAKADTCYEVLKLLFESQEEEAFVYLGKGGYFDAEVEDKRVFFIVSLPNGLVSVSGLNQNGKPEGYGWVDVSQSDGLIAFTEFCMGYETLASYLDDCDELVGAIYLSEDGDPIFVDNASTADAFVSAVNSWLEQQ